MGRLLAALAEDLKHVDSTVESLQRSEAAPTTNVPYGGGSDRVFQSCTLEARVLAVLFADPLIGPQVRQCVRLRAPHFRMLLFDTCIVCPGVAAPCACATALGARWAQVYPSDTSATVSKRLVLPGSG